MVGQREPVSFVAASAARLGDNVRKAELEEITGRASAVGVAAKGLRAGGRGPRPVLVAIGERRASGRCWVLWLAALCLLFMLTDSQTAGLLPPETKPYSGTKPTTIHQVARTIQRKKGSPYRGVREEERGPTALSNIAFLYPAGREPVGETLFPSVENSTILFLHVFKVSNARRFTYALNPLTQRQTCVSIHNQTPFLIFSNTLDNDPFAARKIPNSQKCSLRVCGGGGSTEPAVSYLI